VTAFEEQKWVVSPQRVLHVFIKCEPIDTGKCWTVAGEKPYKDCLIHLTLLHNGVIDPSLLRSLLNSIYNSLESHMITVYQVHTNIFYVAVV